MFDVIPGKVPMLVSVSGVRLKWIDYMLEVVQ